MKRAFFIQVALVAVLILTIGVSATVKQKDKPIWEEGDFVRMAVDSRTTGQVIEVTNCYLSDCRYLVRFQGGNVERMRAFELEDNQYAFR